MSRILFIYVYNTPEPTTSGDETREDTSIKKNLWLTKTITVVFYLAITR
jgi:hypothetical protein